MKKLLGLILVFAIAFQASTAIPAPAPQGVFGGLIGGVLNTFQNFANSVSSSLSSAVRSAVTGLSTIMNQTFNTVVDVAEQLVEIPAAAVTAAIDLLKVKNAATEQTIAGVIAGLKAIRDAATNSQLIQFIDEIQDQINDIPAQLVPLFADNLKTIVSTLGDLAKGATDDITNGVVNTFRPIVNDMFEMLTTPLNMPNVLPQLTQGLQNLVSRLPNLPAAIAERLTNATKNLIGDISGIAETILDTANQAAQTLANRAQELANRLSSFATSAFNNLKTVAQKVIDRISTIGTDAANLLNGAVAGISQSVTAAKNALEPLRTKLSVLGLQARSTFDRLTALIGQVTTKANEARVSIQNNLVGLINRIRDSAANAQTQFETGLKNLSADIKAAIESGVASAENCAKAAEASANQTLAAALSNFNSCQTSAEDTIQNIVNGTLDQVTNALAGTSRFSDAAIDCIQDHQGQQTNAVEASACLAALLVTNTVTTLAGSLDITLGVFQTNADVATAAAQTCFGQAVLNSLSAVGQIRVVLGQCLTG